MSLSEVKGGIKRFLETRRWVKSILAYSATTFGAVIILGMVAMWATPERMKKAHSLQNEAIEWVKDLFLSKKEEEKEKDPSSSLSLPPGAI